MTLTRQRRQDLRLKLLALFYASHVSTCFTVSRSCWVNSRLFSIGEVFPEYSPSATINEFDDHHQSTNCHKINESPDDGFIGEEQDQTSDYCRVVLAALEPGSLLKIQIGDTSLARKAWKKRRRNKSPLLAPCSILTLDSKSCIQKNVLYLLKKFGSPRLSLAQLSQRYRSHFRSSSSLSNQARRMLQNFPTTDTTASSTSSSSLLELLQVLFPPGNTHGVELIKSGANGDWFVKAERFSLPKARKQAAAAAIVQFEEEKDDLNSSDEGTYYLHHTGLVRTRSKEGEYQLQPLSAALRMPQHQNKDPSSLLVGSSSEATVSAYVWDFDPQGDAGAPLLILSLNPPQQQQRSSSSRPRLSWNESTHLHTSLKLGQKLSGTVVKLVRGAALVDVNAGRRGNDENNNSLYPVVGRLPFEEAVTVVAVNEEDEKIIDYNGNEQDDASNEGTADALLETVLSELEEDEDNAVEDDITHLFQFEDGVLTFRDPETGETRVIEMNDDDEMDANGNGAYDVEQLPNRERSLPNSITPSPIRSIRHRLHVGDRVSVFVKSASKQSSQLVLTMNDKTLQHQSMSPKKAAAVSKKLARLEQQVGGWQKLEELRGRECDGVVKATSSLGFLYVQPTSLQSLPVGIACDTKELQNLLDLSAGDAVRIQIEGVDPSRGQLALKVLGKLTP